jgi:NAD(P)-dependent dehydrogenase (short-subunit alcohol dehydrogenase family)
MQTFFRDQWAVILGASSGFGLATAHKLASEGMSICAVHRDRRGAMDRIEPEFARIRETGARLLALNLDALSKEGMEQVVGALGDSLGPSGQVRVLLHSIALGNLKPAIPGADPESPLLEDEDMVRTIHSMGTSLLAWVQRLYREKMFAGDARVIGLTSEGNEVAWRGYAAVSAAKCALEAVSRSIAVEFAAAGIRSNVLQAGVTDTPALRLIPGNEKMKAAALARNPMGRLTEPRDVANAVYLLSREEASWINGALIRVDGGEHIGSA